MGNIENNFKKKFLDFYNLNLAIGESDKDNIYLKKLFLSRNSLSNNIYLTNENQPFNLVPCTSFNNILKILIEKKIIFTEDEFILRMNCEGSEFFIIKDLLRNNLSLSLICGSLNDVKKKHGDEEYKNMMNLLKERNINFVYFKASDPSSWLNIEKYFFEETSRYEKNSVGIIGLGYVGLPLAISFGKKRNCIGFDLNKVRVNDLKKAFDRNKEFSTNQIKDSINLKFTNNLFDLENCEFLIVTAPTPITKNKEPDLSFIEKAAKDISKIIKKKMIIILESTVYPGVTEDFFAKIISLKSGLRLNKDFFVGYSPERINPGDKLHSLENVTKVVSGSNKLITKKINTLYKSIIKEIFVTKDIKTAEAAKIIENIQRDVNIALINEYYQLFEKLNLNTHEILKAASTKWNFLNFKPGLVGGHCIGVDPYYLTHLAKKKVINQI